MANYNPIIINGSGTTNVGIYNSGYINSTGTITSSYYYTDPKEAMTNNLNITDKNYINPYKGFILDVNNIEELITTHGSKLRYQFFGSEDSLDMDIMYIFGSMASVNDCKTAASALKFHLGNKYTDPNICTSSRGFITGCYKGSIDEVNNMLYSTYGLHVQSHENIVTRVVPRLIYEKESRVLRGILSHLSRTKHRARIKEALGNNQKSLEVFSEVKLSDISDLNKNNSNLINFYKFFATQYGQLIGLYDKADLFTKSAISTKYPELKKLLYREKFELGLLDELKDNLIARICANKDEIFFSDEYFSSMSVDSEAPTNTITGINTGSVNNITWSSTVGANIYNTLSGGYSVMNSKEDIIKYDVELIKTLNEENKKRK